jgi:hypothetical protein
MFKGQHQLVIWYLMSGAWQLFSTLKFFVKLKTFSLTVQGMFPRCYCELWVCVLELHWNISYFNYFLIWALEGRAIMPPVCVCMRERFAGAKSFLLFWAWEGEDCLGSWRQILCNSEGLGFWQLWPWSLRSPSGCIWIVERSLGTYNTHCVDGSSVLFRCLVYEVTEYSRFLK